MAEIIITPKSALVDEVVNVKVCRLQRKQKVSIVTRVVEDDVRYFSYAYFVSNHHGVVDVSSMEALPGGSYEGVEPMGFVWSQKAEPEQALGRRLVKSDVTTPIVTYVYVLQGHHSLGGCLEEVSAGRWLCHEVCHRHYMAQGVQRIDVTQGRLTGALFIPEGPGPFPGVLDLFGTIGGLTEHRSALLASRGVASIALQYFKPNEPDAHIGDIEYFEEAIDVMLAHKKVRKPHVGVIGVSKGAELSLILGALCSKVKIAIAINGYEYFSLIDHTYKGETFEPLQFYDYDMSISLDEHFIYGYRSLSSITDEDREMHTIPLERGRCKYVLIHGTDDMAVPCHFSKYITDRLDRYNYTDYQVVIYPGAGHLIEPPYSPLFYGTYFPLFGGVMVWGGHQKDHNRAQVDSWEQILNLFKHELYTTSVDVIQSQL